MFLGTVLLCFSFICLLSLSKPNIVNNNTDSKGSSGSTIPYPDNTVGPSRTSETSTEYVKTLTSKGGNYTGKEFASQSTFSYSATYAPGTLSTGELECAEGPEKVENLSVTEGSHAITLNWTNPSKNDSCVTHYVIEWKSTMYENSSNGSRTTKEFFVIEGLEACVNYEVSVRAMDSNTNISEPEVRNVTTLTDVPGPVVDLDVKSSPHSVSLEWMKPSNDGDCVTHYAISWRHTGSENTTSIDIGKEEYSFVIGNLDACVEYEISVSAVNENEEGNITSVNRTTETVVPGPVVDLDVKSSPHSVSLEWMKPSNDGDCVTHYAISWRHTGSENTTSIDIGKEEYSFVIGNLDACVEYEVSVSAVNENEEGNITTVNKTTETVVPGQVVDLDLKPNPHNISLQWMKPSNDGDCVTHYAISWRHTGSENTNSIDIGKEEYSFVIGNLDACVEYEISVSAVNENEEGNITSVNRTTETFVPGQVVDLDLKPNPHSVSLQWMKPSNDGDCVTHYAISWRHTGSENTNSIDIGKEEYSFVIGNLDACVEYEISVSAVNENEEGNITSVNRTTETVVPGEVVDLDLKPNPHNISLQWMKPSNDGDCVTHYVISWRHTGSENTTSIDIGKEEYSFVIGNLDACVEYEISVSAVNDNEEGNITAVNMKTETEVTGAPKYEDILCLESEKACLKWMLPDLSSNKCQLQNCTVVCNALEPPGLPLKNGVSGEFQNDFVVVDVIGLSSSTSYSCVAYITNEGGTSKNGSSTPFTTEQDVPVGVIVGVLSAIIIVGLLAVVFVTYHKGTLVWPPKLFARAKQATVRPQPVLVKKFPEYCVQMLEMPTRLGSEYQLLATLSVDISASSSCVNGQMPENKWKNRYVNILPYDDTRVTLDLIDGDPSSHYINASFIKGYSNDIEYIATQGPKEETCLDFWRMVFQHDVSVIVMVTNLVEQDKVKCHQYYPDLRENIVFGDMTIRCTTEVNFPIHTARTLVLVKGDKKRKLSHLHFREWPDFGVPQSTDIMIHFCQTMRHHMLAAEQGLILVHCSAGVGRTGTLIAVDILLQHISENKKVDIFGTVFKLRKQRTNMVQTEGQYKYIYRCIKDAIEDPTIVNPATATNNPLEPIYENVGTSLNSLQYEKLPKVSSKNSSSESECEL
ncbi:receptor-type tyrosine-protein phosphatase H isoform X4 [Cryptotermes secundus]|uniref:receptor-type tyrosine-protein phosphatase H isoform X4 n=1 Tax=Cryptotermes secundus TaxID=105785 RepID=UPI000CD7BCD8|nr:receptor-type tyrosine-protein phosphatase H isoform X4 [Cryptotermes secundus]